MNRMEEFEALSAKLDAVPDWDPVERARKRTLRLYRVWKPLATMAAVFCLFVTLINVSPTASAMCREIPLLKQLVELLTFNPSLRLMVEHDYVQVLGLEQTKQEVTARVEHLIVDQKQVNIFYTLSSDRYEALSATPEILNADGERISAITSHGGINEENGVLRSITIDFLDEDVPERLILKLDIHNNGAKMIEAPVQAVDEWETPSSPEAFLQMEFLLEFDPQYTEQGRTVLVDQTVEIDGQRITVTDMEIYPSHIRINVQEDAQNTAWLQSLRFSLELEDGRRVERISNGITATGSADTPSMVSYRAESTFFYDADCIRLLIIGADFADKETSVVHVDLENLKSDPLPENVSLLSAERASGGTVLTFLVKEDGLNHVQLLSHAYWNADGEEYYINRSTHTIRFDEETGEELAGYEEQGYYLDGYFKDEVWVELNYTDIWLAEEPVIVELERQN